MTLLALVLAYLLIAPPLCRWLERVSDQHKGIDQWH